MKYIILTSLLIFALFLLLMLLRLLFKCLGAVKRRIEKMDENIVKTRYSEEKRKAIEKQMRNVYTFNNNSVFTSIERIVSIVKPIGPWTNYIISSKIEYLMSIKEALNEARAQGDDSKIGYWQVITSKTSKNRGKGKGDGMYK